MGMRLCTDFPVTCEERWVRVPGKVVAGRTIETHATGKWNDSYIRCGPEGYWAPLFYFVGRPPRIPDEMRYFRLLGRVYGSDTPPPSEDCQETFVIGRGRLVTPTRSGWLYVFANDGFDRYFNNRGAVALSVEQH